MQSPARAYSFGLAGTVVARALSVVAGVLSLWLLTRLLGTEDFAGYAAAMSYVILIGHVVGLGIERSMLLRVSPEPLRPGRMMGGGMMRRVLLVVTVLSLIGTAIALAMLTSFPAMQQGRTDDWIVMLWPIIPAQAILLVLVNWYQSNHRFGLSQVAPGLNDAARCAAFILVYLLGLGIAGVAVGAAFGAVLPIAILFLTAFGRTETQPDKLELTDFTAGLQFLVMRFSIMGLRQLDLVVMGFAVGGLETAVYAVASRIADIASVGQQGFVQTYAARVRRHLVDGDTAAITREYNATRALSFLLTLGITLGLVATGEFALGLFGNFTTGYPVVLLIAAGHLLTASFGGHDVHLSMTGHLREATANRLFALIVFVGLLIVLVPRLEETGAALSFVGASVMYSIVGLTLLRRYGEGEMIPPVRIGAGVLASLGLVGVALTGASPVLASALLVVCGAVVLYGEMAWLRKTLGLSRGD